MQFNRKQFWQNYRKEFIGPDEILLQSTVDNLEKILNYAEIDRTIKSIPEFAYMLATVHHETFIPATHSRYAPVREIGSNAYFIKRYWTNKKVRDQLGNEQQSDAYRRCGRGLVQLTGLSNDEKATKEIKKQLPDLVKSFEVRSGQKFDLVEFPDQALDLEIAYAVLSLGMRQGWFTSKKLSDYFNANKKDYKNARRIINGTDKAALIAGYAEKFEQILNNSKIDAPSSQASESGQSKQSANSSTVEARQSNSGGETNEQTSKASVVVEPPENNSPEVSTKSETILQTVEKYGDKIQTTTEKVTNIQNSFSPISKSSWFMTLIPKITGVCLLVYGWAKDNWFELLIALGLIALAAYVYSHAKDRAVSKTLNGNVK